MNKLLTTIAVLSVVAAPAFAQGYDPRRKNIGETGIYSVAFGSAAARLLDAATPARCGSARVHGGPEATHQC